MQLGDITDIHWGDSLAEARARARELRRPILVKPANQGVQGQMWCPAASYVRAVVFAEPAIAAFAEGRFVPLLVSMTMHGDHLDDPGRELVLRHCTQAPFPGLMVFDPDDLSLLAATELYTSAERSLNVLLDVLARRPDLAGGAAPEPPEVYDRDDPRQAALLRIEESLETADDAGARAAASDLAAWLDVHGEACTRGAPLAWLLLGQARYLTADFEAADVAWAELIARFPAHPLRHRADYHRLDHDVWPEPAHPSIARARLPGVADRGVHVPYPDVRARNLEALRGDPRYRWSPSGIPFVEIPPGTFTMGTDSPRSPREAPARRVTITRPFLLAAWPVTRAAWRLVYPDAWPGAESEGLAAELPATEVSFARAAAFIAALAERDGWSYRFPTEAEWEYAARDGLEGAPFPWGHEPLDPARCNYALPRPVPVASYPPTRRGLFEMLGNVAELSSDRWLIDGFARTPREVVDPVGPSAEEQPAGTRVIMPSGCGSPMLELHARIDWRGAVPHDYGGGFFGLRLACELP